MKKSIAIVLGLASLAACTKSSVSYEQTDQISFAPIANVNKTKAAIDGTTFPTANSMGVYAYYKSGVKANSDNTKFSDPDTYLSNAKFSNKASSTLWAGDPNPYYWPKTGSLIFAAYSPETPALTHTFSVTEKESEGGAKETDIIDKFEVNNYVQSSDLSKTVDLLWSPVTAKSYDKTNASSGVPMTFYHAMSWVTFQAAAADDTSVSKFKIKSVKLLNVVNKGSLVTNKAEASWTVSTESDDKKTLDVYVPDTYEVLSSKTAKVIETNEKGTVVIPQTLTGVKVVVVFSQATAVANGWTADQTVTIDLSTCKSDNVTIGEWANGMHYVYTLEFGYEAADEIKINPSVNKWEDVTVDNISVN